MRLFFASLAWLVLAAPFDVAQAARSVRVFEVDLRSAESAAALQDAMRQALVRATGRRDAASDPALAGIVTDAQRYVQAYRPGPHGGTQVVFDGAAVESAIGAAGRSVWERSRPFTLITLEPQPTGPEAEAVRRALDHAALARGLPINLAPVALTDGSGAELDRAAVLQAARRLGGDAVLVGRGDPAQPSRSWQWTLHTDFSSSSWAGSLEDGIHGAVDALARVEGEAATAVESEARLQVEGIASLTDYVTVGRLLDALPGVRRVSVEETTASTVTYRVLVRGGADALRSSLAGSSSLTGSGVADAQLLYRYRP